METRVGPNASESSGNPWLALSQLGMSVGGLFSEEFINEPWGLPKIVDMLKHLWMPVLIIAINGTAGGIRTTRANLLDEMHKPYVQTARAKGVKEGRMVWKYPVRVAMNPMWSTIGFMLPLIISGATIVDVVLNLPTLGPLLLDSLQSQDMYLAGSLMFILTFLTLVGTFISDIILAISDPRIRYE